MPASGTTANFKLPQYKPLDTVSMLVTFNGAMQTIDEQMQNIKNTADTGSVDITDMQKLITTLVTDIATIKRQISDASPKYIDVNYNQPGVQYPSGQLISSGSLKLGYWMAVGINKENMQTTPGIIGTNAYTIFTTPDNIFNLTPGTSNAVIIGYLTTTAEAQGYTFLLAAWRDNNITYVGFKASADTEVRVTSASATIISLNQ